MTRTFILWLLLTTGALAPAPPSLSPSSKKASSLAGSFFFLPHNARPRLSFFFLLSQLPIIWGHQLLLLRHLQSFNLQVAADLQPPA